MFDYFFYRLYILYRNKEKGINPISTSAIYLSFLQLLILFSIVMSINITFHGSLTNDLSDINKIILKIGIVIFLFLIYVFNYFYYKRKHKVLLTRFKNHPLNKKFKEWMLFFLGIGLLIFPFVYKELLKLIF